MWVKKKKGPLRFTNMFSPIKNVFALCHIPGVHIDKLGATAIKYISIGHSSS